MATYRHFQLKALQTLRLQKGRIKLKSLDVAPLLQMKNLVCSSRPKLFGRTASASVGLRWCGDSDNPNEDHPSAAGCSLRSGHVKEEKEERIEDVSNGGGSSSHLKSHDVTHVPEHKVIKFDMKPFFFHQHSIK
eukprot:3944197-Ditylum_brightwellii.AAC.1